jgi:hypothetical protein
MITAWRTMTHRFFALFVAKILCDTCRTLIEAALSCSRALIATNTKQVSESCRQRERVSHLQGGVPTRQPMRALGLGSSIDYQKSIRAGRASTRCPLRSRNRSAGNNMEALRKIWSRTSDESRLRQRPESDQLLRSSRRTDSEQARMND